MAGWVELTTDSLRAVQPPPSLTPYFNGADPDWSTVASSALQPRALVDKLLARTRARVSSGTCGIELLRGPTGEGKSTALLQAVSALVSETPAPVVWWRQSPKAELDWAVVEGELANGRAVVIGADDAETLIGSIQTGLADFPVVWHRPLQLLLAAREADWTRTWKTHRLKVDPTTTWRRRVFLQDQHGFGALTPEDAAGIVKAWHASGDLGEVGPDELTSLATALAEASTTIGRRGGALLGALLKTRFTPEGLQSHLASLLADLAEDTLPSTLTLAEVLAVISASDVAELDGIPREIVADLAGVDQADLHRQVEMRLGREALVGASGDLLHGRHPLVSQTIFNLLLSSDTDIAFEPALAQLLESTVRQGAAHGYREGYGLLLNLGPRLRRAPVSADTQPQLDGIAERYARRCVEHQPHMLSNAVGLSALMRETNRAQKAVNEVWEPILDRLATPSEWHDWPTRARGAMREFATAVGEAGDAATALLAFAISLSDACAPERLTPRNLAISFNGLALDSGLVYDAKPNDQLKAMMVSAHACLAAVLSSRARELGYTRRYLTKRGLAVPQASAYRGPEPLVQLIQDAVVASEARVGELGRRLLAAFPAVAFTMLTAELAHLGARRGSA
ncbi:P-loop NTPase [Micromonospora tarensis]|uniref:Novel STAND NTPase 5 domain-containing protein n=1 Tax=Micromonospora tarensis TaxID=2806100 RepID=A0ABS1YK65_9ACTN|nr:hypothetical protein [Micromonospora tarensis]MBM0277574.1 hypothetical protein [Micromonospora tarensis]